MSQFDDNQPTEDKEWGPDGAGKTATILSFKAKAPLLVMKKESQRDQIGRLEYELIVRTSHLKTENDELRGRVEVLEKCLRIITENLQTAKELLGRKT